MSSLRLFNEQSLTKRKTRRLKQRFKSTVSGTGPRSVSRFPLARVNNVLDDGKSCRIKPGRSKNGCAYQEHRRKHNPPKGKRQRKELGNSAVPNAKGKLKTAEHEKLGTQVGGVAAQTYWKPPALVELERPPMRENAQKFCSLAPKKAPNFGPI
eukprot:FR736404.1.p2 GENE.FR736404.1~~FR736404.1.p2  ORF type:complete len:154 (+),score=21.66 FR736404.1:491-952(+)